MILQSINDFLQDIETWARLHKSVPPMLRFCGPNGLPRCTARPAFSPHLILTSRTRVSPETPHYSLSRGAMPCDELKGML